MEKNIPVTTIFMNKNILYLTIHQRFILNQAVVSQRVWNFSDSFYILNTDYIHKIDEIRVGFNTRTFDRLVQHDSLTQNDVSVINPYPYNNRLSDNCIGRMCIFYFLQ